MRQVTRRAFLVMSSLTAIGAVAARNFRHARRNVKSLVSTVAFAPMLALDPPVQGEGISDMFLDTY